MTIDQFLALYDSWHEEHRGEIENRKRKADLQMDGFLSLFGTREQLEDMSIMDYAFQTNGRRDSLCFLIDFGTDELGINRVEGQSGYQRYGIQLMTNGTDWYPFCKDTNNESRFGNNPNEVFIHFKTGIISLLEATENNEVDAIEAIDIPQLHKNKLHFIFSRGNSIPIYVQPHLNKLLDLFGLEIRQGETTFAKRDKLLSFLRSMDREDITPWHFADFVYHEHDFKNLLKERDTEITKETFSGRTNSNALNPNTPVSGSDGLDSIRESAGKTGENIVFRYLETHRRELNIKRNSEIVRVCDHPIQGIHCDFKYIRKTGALEEDVFVEAKAHPADDPDGFHFDMSAYEKMFMDEHRDHYSVYYINDVFNQRHIIELLPDEIDEMLQPKEYFVNSTKTA